MKLKFAAILLVCTALAAAPVLAKSDKGNNVSNQEQSNATSAQLAAYLLRDAAIFFRDVGKDNQSLKQQMNENASVYEDVADLVEKNPLPALGNETHAQLAAQLLRDAATFFRNVAASNAPLKQQLNDNAAAYDKAANLVEKDPLGTLDLGGEKETK